MVTREFLRTLATPCVRHFGNEHFCVDAVARHVHTCAHSVQVKFWHPFNVTALYISKRVAPANHPPVHDLFLSACEASVVRVSVCANIPDDCV